MIKRKKEVFARGGGAAEEKTAMVAAEDRDRAINACVDAYRG